MMKFKNVLSISKFKKGKSVGADKSVNEYITSTLVYI